ncbi:replication-relaxation family protein [Streptomyces olivoreticuli]
MKDPQDPRIGEADEAILHVINKFHYMTADQVGRLLYPCAHDENRYVQRRLRRLSEANYLLRLRELPTPRIGSAPHVFTLADRGRRLLADRGWVLESTYYRPSEERAKARDHPFMEHTLAAIDVLVCAEMLCQDWDVLMPRLFNERQLKRSAVRVQPAGRPDARPMAVIPDAWFELHVPLQDAVAVALELDRGTEQQQHWRRKVASIAAWARGPYRDAFQAENLTVAVVTPGPARRDQLQRWTTQELQALGMEYYNDIFLFTDASPIERAPFEFFFCPLWYPAGGGTPVSLLDEPTDEDAAPPL